MYGYELAGELARRSKGILELGQGTLYPLLYSMENRKLIRAARQQESSETGRRRRYYELTPAGRADLRSRLATWSEITGGVRLALAGA